MTHTHTTHTHTHRHTLTLERDLKQMGISHHFQSIAIAMLLTVAGLLPFVRQLPQMEFSAYLRKDSSKWHCPVADDYHVCNNKLQSFSFPLLHKHSHTHCSHTHTHTHPHTHLPPTQTHNVFWYCADIPVQLFVVSLMTFTGSVCVLVVFLKHSCAYCHCNSTVSARNRPSHIQFASLAAD